MSSVSSSLPTGSRHRTPLQVATLVVALVFLLVGVLGFIPGPTTSHDQLTIASVRSTAYLLGLFQVSYLHNAVHLMFGLIGVIAARTIWGARRYLRVGGVLYLLLFVYGLVVPMQSMANFVPFNLADDVLHLGLGIGMVALGLLLGRGLIGRRIPSGGQQVEPGSGAAPRRAP